MPLGKSAINAALSQLSNWNDIQMVCDLVRHQAMEVAAGRWEAPVPLQASCLASRKARKPRDSSYLGTGLDGRYWQAAV